MVGGCFYIEPVVDINRPPEILSPENADTEIPVLLNQTTVLQVVATDPDSQEVACFWTMEGREPPAWTCDQEDTLVFTVLYLDYDPDLEDKLVVAHIYDAESNEDVLVRFRLNIDAPEAP